MVHWNLIFRVPLPFASDSGKVNLTVVSLRSNDMPDASVALPPSGTYVASEMYISLECKDTLFVSATICARVLNRDMRAWAQRVEAEDGGGWGDGVRGGATPMALWTHDLVCLSHEIIDLACLRSRDGARRVLPYQNGGRGGRVDDH